MHFKVEDYNLINEDLQNEQTVYFSSRNLKIFTMVKSILATILIVLALSSAKANPNVSSVCEGVREAFVNNYFDCAGYFWCSSLGVPIPIRCPDGFWFDATNQACVLSGSIACTLCQNVGGPQALSVTKTAKHDCPTDGIHFMPHEKCDSFRVCVHGMENGKWIL